MKRGSGRNREIHVGVRSWGRFDPDPKTGVLFDFRYSGSIRTGFCLPNAYMSVLYLYGKRSVWRKSQSKWDFEKWVLKSTVFCT